MRAYMKSKLPFHGVQGAAQKRVWKTVFPEYVLGSFEEWQATVLALWRGARYREERYAAIALTGERPYRDFQTLRTVPLYEELIVTGAWWDYVDWIASKRIGELMRRYPRPMARTMRAWSRSDDIWKRRTSILCQLSFKADTDLGLLYDCLESSLGEREFFLRKAIGWALREYSKTDPGEVARYVRENGDRLSPLSRREAMKRIERRRRSMQT
jgi:3-methyladenine DNA glycosylase AlkD